MPTLAPALRPFRRSHHATSTHPTSSRTPGAGMASVGVPAAIALCYCLYTAFIAGDNGWSTGLTWLIALVSAAVVGVLCYAIGRWQPDRQPETIGAVYTVVFGIAMGYLLSLNNWSILKASLVGLALAASMGVCAYYIVHTHRRQPFQRRGRTPSGR